ncbi:helix-hairpin-helix domain-containing protein [Roseofilum sp. Belize BBD 4]|nr:helix-hairpin-helix domain-containing protein [Roseofilum sp. Belize Diploria]MBP0035699.1 helix-hairpin-helix domain-containing protein [Roseofilum sp. Belize BBD 4]HBQ99004.1 hypothetical protein [Cyanobacteria bacterium UBA11691]
MLANIGSIVNNGAIAQASTKQLQQVPGIGPNLAQNIYDHFHKQ